VTVSPPHRSERSRPTLEAPVRPGPPGRGARTDKDLAPRRRHNSTFLHNPPQNCRSPAPLPPLSQATAEGHGPGCLHFSKPGWIASQVL